MKEIKQQFIKDLGIVLKKYGIVDEMVYEDDWVDEFVKITKCETTRIVYVTKDSKLQMLKDIINQGGLD